MYAKIFAQIYDGTLCTKGPWQALVTFQQLLVLADQDGTVDMTISAIARRTTIPIEVLEPGIVALLLPDPESRTPVEEGRRIVPLSVGRTWGWRIVNYMHYRQLKREDDRREYHRQYWLDRKLKDSTTTQHSQHSQQPQPNQPIAEAEAEANAVKGAKAPSSPALLPTPDDGQGLLLIGDDIPGIPTCPVKQLVNLFVSKVPELPKPRYELWKDGVGSNAMRQRWKWLLSKDTVRENGARYATTAPEAIEWFGRFFDMVQKSDFLTGRNTKARKKFNLTWLMTKENFSKVVHGEFNEEAA